MLEKPDYLKIGKPTDTCASCGKPLAEQDRLASILLPLEESQEPEAEATPSRDRKSRKSTAVAPQRQSTEKPDDQSGAKRPHSGAPLGKGKTEGSEDKEEEAGFLRLDYCTKCWNAMKEQAYFSFWIGRRSAGDLPVGKLTKAERNVALAALFDSLAERGDEEQTDYSPHLFFLAHLLMKFKIFKWMPSVAHPETGEPMLRFLRAQTGEEVLVRNVEMPQEMVARVKEEVETYLQQTTGRPVKI